MPTDYFAKQIYAVVNKGFVTHSIRIKAKYPVGNNPVGE